MTKIPESSNLYLNNYDIQKREHRAGRYLRKQAMRRKDIKAFWGCIVFDVILVALIVIFFYAIWP